VIDTGDLQGFSSVTRKQAEEKAAEKKPDGLFTRKMKRIFGAVGDMRALFFQGFKMGAVVGGIFGGLTGVYYAFVTRQIRYIFIVALPSAGSFGFFMGVGNIMRSEMEPAVEDEASTLITRIDAETGRVSHEPVYKRFDI